jgi:hypothetical protein
MTEVVTQDRATKKPKRDKVRKVADDIVTPNSLATHFGCTRQNTARLTAEAVVEQRSDGHYDQTASRLRYIKHLCEMHGGHLGSKLMRSTPRPRPRFDRDREGAQAAAAMRG